MHEAAPRAAMADMAVSEALEVLRLEWGRAYRIGWGAVRDWWARRRDGLGGDVTAADYPVAAVCRVCGGRIRLGSKLQMEWRHAPAVP